MEQKFEIAFSADRWEERTVFGTSYAIGFAGNLPHVRKSDAGMLHVRHPPSQLFADGIIGSSLREATHLPFRAPGLLPSDISWRPVEASEKATRATTRGRRAP